MNQLTICLIISVLTVISFVWGKLSLATTAMTSMMAFFITGCIDASTVLGCFSNASGIMIVAMFIVAAGFNKTKFVRNVASGISRIAKGSITKVMIGYIVAAVVLCQFIKSNLIPFCILSPLLIRTVEEMGIKPSKVMYSLGIAVIVTCQALPLGGGATVYAELNGYLAANGSLAQMSIWDPMISRLPVVILTAIYCIFIAPRFAPNEPVVAVQDMNVENVAGNAMKDQEMSPFQETCGYLIFFGVSLALLVSSNFGWPTWAICVIGAIAMVLTGVLKPKEATSAIPVWVYLLFVGSIAMANALSQTGAGELIGEFLASLAAKTGNNSLLIYLIFFLVPYIATQFMFNQTTQLILFPIVIQTCLALGANPIGPVILIQQASFASFMTPMATGTVPYYMGLGGYDQKTILKMGILPSIIICIVSVVWNSIMFPLF